MGAKKTCVSKGCNQSRGLKKAKSGNWYCVTHHPDSKKKHKKNQSAAGKASVRVRRKKALAKKLDISLEGNKLSVVNALVAQANFYGRKMELDDLPRAKLMLDIMKLIHEFATEGVGEEEKREQIKEIIDSELPDMVKLADLSMMVGPAQAMKIVPIKVKRDSYKGTTLDGNKLLQNLGKEGAPTISKPETLEFEEREDTSDVPDIEIPAATDSPASDGPGAAPPQEPKPPPKPAETVEERKTRCFRQAKELLGLYKVKVSGNFRKANDVGKIFYHALLDDDVPFNDLQQRVMMPKSATDQPEMMVKDIKEKTKPPKPREESA